MKILILATKFPVSSINESDWLTSELGAELVKRKHEVDVLNLEWSGCSSAGVFSSDKINIYRYRPFLAGRTAFSLGSKWFFSSFKLTGIVVKLLLRRKRYDLVIAFSPCFPMWLAVFFSRFLSKKRHLIYWDFFPVHNYQIHKQFPRWSLPFLKCIEKKLLFSFTRVSCMSPANLKFMNAYFGSNIMQKRDVLPLWTSNLSAFDKELQGLNQRDKVTFLFGGQLTEGRGVETIVSAFKVAALEVSNIQLVVCGAGNLSFMVNEFASEFPHICIYKGQLSREEYLSSLRDADVGIVATVEGVTVPTYPSKCLDYMAASIPIAISIESGSDFGDIAYRNGFGLYCPAGNAEALAKLIVKFSNDSALRSKMGRAGLKYLVENHDVNLIVDKVLES